MYWSLLALGLAARAEPPVTPEETARVFFQSVIDRDWTRLATVCPDPETRAWLADERIVEIVELGTAYTTDDYAGVYVPYTIQVRDGARITRKRHHLALRDDNPQHRYVFDGGY